MTLKLATRTLSALSSSWVGPLRPPLQATLIPQLSSSPVSALTACALLSQLPAWTSSHSTTCSSPTVASCRARLIPTTCPAQPQPLSLTHLLSDPDATPSAIRQDICAASHPDPMRGHRLAHALYMTVHDARPLGNGRCLKTGPTHMHCDICWHVDRTLRRELTSHVGHDCPYSRLVIDHHR